MPWCCRQKVRITQYRSPENKTEKIELNLQLQTGYRIDVIMDAILRLLSEVLIKFEVFHYRHFKRNANFSRSQFKEIFNCYIG